MGITRIFSRLIFFALLINVSAYAQPYTPPQNIDLFGKQYIMAFKNENAYSPFYEYTTDGESVENWTHLITLTYVKHKLDPYAFILATKQALDIQKPVPHYSLYQKGEHAYAMLIFEPSIKRMNFETDVQKSFHPENCDGTIILQYGVHTPVLQQQTEEEKTTLLKAVFEQLKLDAEKMLQNEWIPKCE